MKFIIILVAIVLVMSSDLCKALPRLTDIEVEEQGDSAEINLRAKRHDSFKASEMNKEVVRSKRDVQNKNTNQNCCDSGTNSGSGSGNGSGNTSKCVCKTYQHNNMNYNNNNKGATVYNNMYYICNCDTNPNPNNVMSCCVPNKNNKNCNCCSSCQCGCNNGTNVCVCSGIDGTGNSNCSTSQSNSGGNVCYTFDKACCKTQNTKHPPLHTGFANHHGPIFIYNNYYYYCTCSPNKNIRHPSTCSTTCTCGCQSPTARPFIAPTKPATAQPFIAVTKLATTQQYIASTTLESRTQPIRNMLKDVESNLLEQTDKLKKFLKVLGDTITIPPIFYTASTKPGVTLSPFDNINLGARGDTQKDSAKSNQHVYTYTFTRAHTVAPRHSQETQTPMSPTKMNDFRRNNHNRGLFDGDRVLDLSELLKHFKKY